MTRVEQLERQVLDLSETELAQFRRWFIEADFQIWNRRLERDAAAGKLDALAEKALRAHARGESTPL